MCRSLRALDNLRILVSILSVLVCTWRGCHWATPFGSSIVLLCLSVAHTEKNASKNGQSNDCESTNNSTDNGADWRRLLLLLWTGRCWFGMRGGCGRSSSTIVYRHNRTSRGGASYRVIRVHQRRISVIYRRICAAVVFAVPCSPDRVVRSSSYGVTDECGRFKIWKGVAVAIGSQGIGASTNQRYQSTFNKQLTKPIYRHSSGKHDRKQTSTSSHCSQCRLWECYSPSQSSSLHSRYYCWSLPLSHRWMMPRRLRRRLDDISNKQLLGRFLYIPTMPSMYPQVSSGAKYPTSSSDDACRFRGSMARAVRRRTKSASGGGVGIAAK